MKFLAFFARNIRQLLSVFNSPGLYKLTKIKGLKTKIMLSVDGKPKMGALLGSSKAAKKDFLRIFITCTPDP
jgi:hypothetical protein